ncbi:hypothetical protein ACE1SV_66270 [Streptomyces sp. E-15]
MDTVVGDHALHKHGRVGAQRGERGIRRRIGGRRRPERCGRCGRLADHRGARQATWPRQRALAGRPWFLSAFAALGDPVSRAYYDKKIAQGKHHTQALLCLARRRAGVLFAMLRDGTFYEPRPATADNIQEKTPSPAGR